MRDPYALLAIAAVSAIVAVPAGCQAQALPVTVTENSDTIPPYEVLELTFQHDGEYADPFFDVVIEVTFTSPSGEGFRVGGFHYGSSEGVEIRPDGVGDNADKDDDNDGFPDKQETRAGTDPKDKLSLPTQ